MNNLLLKIKPHFDPSLSFVEQLQKLTFEGVITATEYWWLYGQIANPSKYADIIAALSSTTLLKCNSPNRQCHQQGRSDG